MLSIDPSSPFTQGALLGDRIRLTDHFLDPGVFIRSMANRGALGGLSEASLQAALLMDAAGRDDVFLETVGVGQAEVDIIDHADTVLLVLMPGGGDCVQALKAGIMEIPDIIVVNKADHPLTQTMVREIRGVLSLAPQGLVEGADPADRGRRRARRRRAHGQAARAPRAHRGSEGTLSQRRRHNLRNEVLALATHRVRRDLEQRLAQGDGLREAHRRRRRAPPGPGQRRGDDPRARTSRSDGASGNRTSAMLSYPSRCFTQYEVNIGYYPNRVAREATLRDGPGEQFRILERLAAGQRVGRQSVRNPQRSSTPPRRDSRNRYAWVYALEGGRSGWVRADVLATDPGGWADGPAHADFEVGGAPGVRHAPRRRPRPRFTIGRRGGGRRVVDERDVYLRYAARSTAFALPRS